MQSEYGLRTRAFELISSLYADEDQIREAFRSGEGMGWHEHDHRLLCGTERFFRPGYRAHLVAEWLPALDGVVEKLQAGAKVADVGCGHGASTILMAQAFLNSTFFGFDYHDGSIEQARSRAADAGVAANTTFETAAAKDFPGDNYDLVCMFDCLHDMGDPVRVAKHVRDTLADDGTWMIVEPFAGDTVEENLNPVGRVFYGASTVVCTPASLSQKVELALGAQAGEAQLGDVSSKAASTTSGVPAKHPSTSSSKQNPRSGKPKPPGVTRGCSAGGASHVRRWWRSRPNQDKVLRRRSHCVNRSIAQPGLTCASARVLPIGSINIYEDSFLEKG